jgi:hypothetical protein
VVFPEKSQGKPRLTRLHSRRVMDETPVSKVIYCDYEVLPRFSKR